jgi:hypothetical protein
MTNYFKKPDLNAPRFRAKRTSILNESLYLKFKEKYPQYKDISNSTLKSIIVTFNKRIWENAIGNRDGTELPEELGYIFIGTCMPPKKYNVDYIKSKELNQNVKHRNFESDNFIAKIFYTNFISKYRLQDRELWQFKGERDFTRAVAKHYPENWKKYVQVENFTAINVLFKNKKYKQQMLANTEFHTKDYNEFELD